MEEQLIETTKYGTHYYSDKANTILHREDGPAVERANGNKLWYINDKRHREAGPAVEYGDGSKAWYINGERHRENGPAIDNMDGYKAWYINDEHLTEEEFNTRMSSIELKLNKLKL